MATCVYSQPTPRSECAAIAGDTMARLHDAPQFLGVHVDQLAGATPFVALYRRGRVQIAQPTQAQAAQYRAHRRARQRQPRRDLGGHQLGLAQQANQRQPRRPQGMRTAMRRRAAVVQPPQSFRPVARQPFIDRALGYAEGDGDGAHRPMLPQHAVHQQGSTLGCGSRILVDVHPAVSSEVDRLAPISFRDSVRVNNPHRNHS